MRPYRFIFVVLVLIAGSATIRASETDLTGGEFWSPDRDARIQFSSDHGEVSARIVWLEHPGLDKNNPDPAGRTRNLLGLVIIQGFRLAGPDTWDGGTVYDPDSGDTYRGSIWFKASDPNHLYLRGFVGLSLFGRTEIFDRVIVKN